MTCLLRLVDSTINFEDGDVASGLSRDESVLDLAYRQRINTALGRLLPE